MVEGKQRKQQHIFAHQEVVQTKQDWRSEDAKVTQHAGVSHNAAVGLAEALKDAELSDGVRQVPSSWVSSDNEGLRVDA